MTWIEAGVVPEQAGSWVVVNRHRESVLVVRGEGGLAAFFNVCQHRGHRLVGEKSGCSKAFACPYHNWIYGLAGDLRHVPDIEGFGPAFDPADHGLVPVPVEERDGVAWIRLEGDTVERVDQAPGALLPMFSTPRALVVRGVLEPARCRAIVAALEEKEPPEFRFSPAFDAFSIGRILDHAVDLDDYFEARPGYVALLEELGGDLEGRLLQTLQGLGDVQVPEHPERGPYGLTTIRRYPTGGQIPPHADTEQLGGPQYAHLRTMLDTSEIVSWFVTLQAPDAGGELAIYDVAKDSELGRQVYANRLDAVRTLEGADVVPVRPEAGDLLIFSSGRGFHRVTPVIGPRARWTIGGFIGRGLDGTLYAFS